MTPKEKLTLYSDGAIARIKNRRISFKECDDDAIFIIFQYASTEVEKAACSHETIRGKVRQTKLKLSKEAMHVLCGSFFAYMKNKSNKK